MERALIPSQRRLVEYVSQHPGATTQQVGKALDLGIVWSSGYDAANNALSRLAKRGIVERERVASTVPGVKESRWTVTAKGREALGG